MTFANLIDTDMKLFESIAEEEIRSLRRHRPFKDLYDLLDALDGAQCNELYRFDRRSVIEYN